MTDKEKYDRLKRESTEFMNSTIDYMCIIEVYFKEQGINLNKSMAMRDMNKALDRYRVGVRFIDDTWRGPTEQSLENNQ